MLIETTVCGREQGGVQASCGRCRVLGCDTKESEWKASSSCAAGPRSGDEDEDESETVERLFVVLSTCYYLGRCPEPSRNV